MRFVCVCVFGPVSVLCCHQWIVVRWRLSLSQNVTICGRLMCCMCVHVLLNLNCTCTFIHPMTFRRFASNCRDQFNSIPCVCVCLCVRHWGLFVFQSFHWDIPPTQSCYNWREEEKKPFGFDGMDISYNSPMLDNLLNNDKSFLFCFQKKCLNVASAAPSTIKSFFFHKNQSTKICTTFFEF